MFLNLKEVELNHVSLVQELPQCQSLATLEDEVNWGSYRDRSSDCISGFGYFVRKNPLSLLSSLYIQSLGCRELRRMIENAFWLIRDISEL